MESLRALVKLLRRAKIEFAVLGEEELDTGDLARMDEEGMDVHAAFMSALTNDTDDLKKTPLSMHQISSLPL